MMKNVPQGWKIEKLGNVAEYINGKAFKPSDWGDFGLPIIRIQNLNGNKEYNYYDDEIEERYIVNDGDVLISWSASLDVYKWNGGRAVLNQHIFNTKIDNRKITDDYFYYSIKKALNTILSNLHGSTMKHITKGRFEAVEILLPPLPQQEKIVSVLDTASALVEKQKALLEKYDLFLKSKFIEMFGSYFTTDKNQWKTLSSVSKFIDYRGKTPPKVDFDGIRLITAKNVKKGFIQNEPEEWIDISAYREWLSRGKSQKGDVLFTTEAPLGNVALLPDIEKVVVGQRIIALRPNDLLVSEFLLFTLLSDDIQQNILSRSTGSTVKGIRSKELAKIIIPLPPIDLQKQFAQIFEQTKILKQKEQQKLEKLKTLYDALMKQAFDGEIE